MAYIGNKLADSYTSFAKQDFTTSATTSYTLDYPVANANEIALFINFVRQEPTTAYTASGVNLTLTSATSATDDMYCVFLGKALQTVNPPAGSVGISQLSATGTPSSSTFLRGDNSWVAAGGVNTPAFEAHLSSNQNPANDTLVKVQFDTEKFDTDGCYDNSTNYRFTPTTAGKYYVYAIVRGGPDSGLTQFEKLFVYIYKNGSDYGPGVNIDNRNNPGTSASISVSSVVELNGSTDYVEIYSFVDILSGTPTFYQSKTIFGAYKLVE